MGDVDRLRGAGVRSDAAPVGIAVLLSLFVFAGCPDGGNATAPPEPEATSLFGEPLYAPPLPDETRVRREAQLVAAQAEFEASPDDPDALIWLGRRTAYLGHYREAIERFTDGVARFPDDPRMLRHRGHRYITVRRFADAIRDLEHAAALIEGTEDEVEPDGLPNVRNIPTSTLHSNIWYHLGLAYYLQNDLENAARCYRECMKVSNNPDMLCATSHWLYMTLRRLGQASEATRLLEAISADMDVIENGDYHRLLLMYKGETASEDLLQPTEDGPASAAIGYGVGNWQRSGGLADQAMVTLKQVIDAGPWAAFGAIAAEADLQRWDS